MDAILRNLSDPAWWFTGLFPVAVAWALPVFFRRLQPHASRARLSLRVRSKRRVKAARHDPLAVTAAIGKANAQFTVFLILAFGYGLALLLLAAPYRLLLTPLAVVLFIPVLAMEIAWLNTDAHVGDLLKARARFRRGRRRGSALPW